MGCRTCGKRRGRAKPMSKTSPPNPPKDSTRRVAVRRPKPRFDRVVGKSNSFGGIINKVKKEPIR